MPYEVPHKKIRLQVLKMIENTVNCLVGNALTGRERLPLDFPLPRPILEAFWALRVCVPSCGHSGKCQAASKETSAVKTPAAATLKCQGVAGTERKPYSRSLEKQPHAELGDLWVYYQYLTLPLGVGGCRKASNRPAAGQDFSRSLFARARARNKEMKSISDRKKPPKT